MSDAASAHYVPDVLSKAVCDQCGASPVTAVVIDAPDDDGIEDVTICKKCLEKAIRMIEAHDDAEDGG